MKKIKRILICGGRDYENWPQFRDEMEKIAFERFARTGYDPEDNFLYDVTVIAGGAKGADDLAYDWAVVNWTKYEEFAADWDKFGDAAGPIRNKQMIDDGKPELVVAFPGGKGTANMIKQAKEAGIEVIDLREI